jgi:hypothetical protein
MKRLLLSAICYLPIALFAQSSQTGSDYIARRLQVPLLDAPQKVPNASVSVSGNPGPATYFYWIVTNGLAGASSPAGPFQISNAPNTLTGGNFNQISWATSLGAVNYDVLRTSTPGPPFGACNCAVGTAITGNITNDQANALNAYTVSTFDPSTLLWAITNESLSAGVSQITFRAGGVIKFSLASNGGAVTLATPFTAPAHQFFTAFSGGGVFSAAQPASADISDGTGSGVVARQTNPALVSPTTTGTDNGAETLLGKTYDTAGAGNVFKFNGIQITAPPAMLLLGCRATATASTTLAVSSGNCNDGTPFQTPVSAGTIKNLRCKAQTGGVNASSGVFTVFKNAVGQTTTCTMGTGTTCSDTTHFFSVADNDLVDVRFTTQAAETLAQIVCTLERQ